MTKNDLSPREKALFKLLGRRPQTSLAIAQRYFKDGEMPHYGHNAITMALNSLHGKRPNQIKREGTTGRRGVKWWLA